METANNFESNLAQYRQSIDDRLAVVSESLINDTLKQYGAQAAIPVEAYCSLLSRGGKRIRGALVINAYEMCGGVDADLALTAASAVEMMHAYILAIDDIQDRSDTRRSGPTAHKIIEQKSIDSNWRNDHAHTGISLALNGALIGVHYAENLLTDLGISAEMRLKILKLMNSTMIITAHGQTGDIINEVNGEVTESDIEAVVLHKTAYYTILNPLQIGMALAGKTDEELALVKNYALALGRVFQITDDALTYTTKATDKDHSVDIKDGKITLIMLHALRHANAEDAVYLRRSLGDQNLSEQDFKKCVDIVVSTGAVDDALNIAKHLAAGAVAETKTFPAVWRSENVVFLHDLVDYILKRNS